MSNPTPSCGHFTFDQATGTCVPKTVKAVCPDGYKLDGNQMCVAAPRPSVCPDGYKPDGNQMCVSMGVAPKPVCLPTRDPSTPWSTQVYIYDKTKKACVIRTPIPPIPP